MQVMIYQKKKKKKIDGHRQLPFKLQKHMFVHIIKTI